MQTEPPGFLFGEADVCMGHGEVEPRASFPPRTTVVKEQKAICVPKSRCVAGGGVKDVTPTLPAAFQSSSWMAGGHVSHHNRAFM